MWNQRYSEPGFAYGTEPNDFLVSSTSLLPPGSRILCLGEGEGRNAVYLAKRGHRVTAVDSSFVGLQKTQSLAEKHGVSIETVEADLSEYIIEPNSFQSIISIFCQLPPGLRRSVHEKICSGLVPDGILVLEGFSKKQIDNDTGGPRNLELLFDLKELKKELEPLELTHCVEIEREVIEGNYHTGVGSVIQIIGSKRE